MSQRLTTVLCMQIVLAVMLAHGAPSDANGKSYHPLIHNHMSRKVLERACAASKDAIDEIVDCFKSNAELNKVVKPSEAGECFTETFKQPFDHSDYTGHRDIVCKNKDKFEDMTGCLFGKMFNGKSTTEVERITEMVIDVGFCVVNALD